jgi:hypothetical protein
MSEMVERVARAIEDSLNSDLDDAWKKAARAAIEAMREPTEEMVKDGDKYIDETPHFLSHARDTWVLMTSIALRDKVDA